MKTKKRIMPAVVLLSCLALAGCVGFGIPVSCIPEDMAGSPPGLDGATIFGEEVDPVLVERRQGSPDFTLVNIDSGETAKARLMRLEGDVWLCELYDEEKIHAYLARFEGGNLDLFDSGELDEYQALLEASGFADAVRRDQWGHVSLDMEDPAELRRFFKLLAGNVRFTEEFRMRYEMLP